MGNNNRQYQETKFQFPSNGKVLSDGKNPRCPERPSPVSIPFKRESPFGHPVKGDRRPRHRGPEVSIPFKRESPFGRGRETPLFTRHVRFNSLQTGKSFRTSRSSQSYDRETSFNSLQTGKSFRTVPHLRIHPIESRFNSLQTGKSFRTRDRCQVLNYTREFQFPSNGKVLSDLL